jgi:guanylate kinase
VSHTTRQPRAGEVEGETYFYVSPSTFTTLISEGGFVEHACFNGNYYGTSRRTIADQTAKGLAVIMEVDMEGVKQIKADPNFDARYVFIKPPSFEALEARLRSRGTENEESVRKRLDQAKIELQYAETAGAYDMILVNDELERSREQLREFVYRSP